MAALVSHAMRRFPTTPPDTSYSSYRLRGESSRQESGESALSRSMRYADPWLYSGVPSTAGGLLLAPALVLCSCTDYINGTAKSRSGNGKKSPTTCKKCKGTRLPLSTLESSYKFGTVRCYPTTALHQSNTPARAGTVRVTSSTTRPSILPSQDPYDLMRRSRLSGPQERARSASPKNKSKGDAKTPVTTKSKGNKLENYNSTFGRKSILECDINPYELVSSNDFKLKDKGITLVNGQRIRVRPSSSDKEYEDIQIKPAKPTRAAPPTPKEKHTEFSFAEIPSTKLKSSPILKSPLSSPKLTETDVNGRFKSILKKPSSFGDSDSSPNLDRTPSPSRKVGFQKSCHFYLPTPLTTPRKKVQFLMEKDQEDEIETKINDKENVFEADSSETYQEHIEDLPSTTETEPNLKTKITKFENSPKTPRKIDPKSELNKTEDDEKVKKACLLKRSFSDSTMMEQKKIRFNDTMALRNQRRKAIPKNFNAEMDNEKTVETILKRPDDLVHNNDSDESDNNPRGTSPPSDSVITDVPNVEDKVEDKTFVEVDKSNDIPLTENSTATLENSTDAKQLEENCENVKNIYKKDNNINEPNSFDKFDKTPVGRPSEEVMIEKLDKCIAKEIYSDLDSPPPLVPPRKRSNNKQPQIPSSPTINTIKIESPIPESPNKTIVQIKAIPVTPPSPTVHKIQIKNEYLDQTNLHNLNVLDNPQRKTSILINGDDCYSTVNVSNNVPLYQSSVVVKDSGLDIFPKGNKKNSSTVYITGTFITNTNPLKESINKIETNNYKSNVTTIENDVMKRTNEVNKTKMEEKKVENEIQKLFVEHSPRKLVESNVAKKAPEHDSDQSSELLKALLRDPVEAVRRNLVPHVCGKSDVLRRPRDRKVYCKNVPSITKKEPVVDPPIEEKNITQNTLEESFLKLRNYETVCEDGSSEHSSSTQYELMDGGSECYTEHSNRSSLTEEEMANRTKFYEMLADSAIIELSESEDHHYESIKMNSEPIYEEIEIPPPLPSNPPPSILLDDLNLDKEFTTRSIFEGASKYDILSYLVDAKERGIVPEDNYNYNYNNSNGTIEEEAKEAYNRVSQLSTVSDSSEDNSLISSPLIEEKTPFQKTAEVERNDSGVGSETSKSSLSKYRTKQEISILCEDCEISLDAKIENEPLLCRKCLKRRSERKEIITEIVETEEKYSRDLQIILDEFYQPMLVAGLLTPDQLSAIFLNAEELLENSQALAERLRDAVEIAQEQGDDDLLTVNIGKIFLEATPMLHAFETYCVRQGAASLLLASLEKDKELLRIFLRVSQMENTMLRRMNLNSFLMVPVQRVTKYPLLLTRLYKVTPTHHDCRDELKESQHKIELHLNHMNSETKDVPSKLWRRIGSSSGRRSSAEMDLVNIKLRKIAVDVLEWNHEEAKFILEGKLLFTQPTDNNWRKGRTIKLTPINALLVINGKPSANKTSTERTDENGLIFSKPGTKEAALLLVRDKNGRYSLLRDPLYLDRCIIAADPAWQSYFEVQELMGKDTFIFKAECEELTQTWYKQLQYHAQGMGSWRKRRNALANIMINGMGLRS